MDLALLQQLWWIPNRSGNTPLHIVAPHPVAFRILMQYGGSDTSILVAPNRVGATPLYLAAHVDWNLYELKFDAYTPQDFHEYVNLPTETGMTALHRAIEFRHQYNVRTLLAAGANPNLPTRDGRTPIHLLDLSSRQPSIAMASLLIGAGANINSQDGDGNTPLHLALSVYCIARKYIRFLLQEGASTELSNRRGKRPLDLLYENRYGFQYQTAKLVAASGDDPSSHPEWELSEVEILDFRYTIYFASTLLQRLLIFCL